MKHSCASFVFFLIVCFTATVAGSKVDREELAVTTVQEFTAEYNNRDIDKLVSLYATDAIMVSEAGVAQGRDAIKDRLSVGIQHGNTIASLRPEKSASSGNLSFTEGIAEVISGGQRLERHYLVVVNREGSHSEIVIHYSLPSPAKAP